MNCQQARHAISDGQTNVPHLATCADCRAWAERLDAIRAEAPEIVTAAPAGLADRVLSSTRTPAPVASMPPPSSPPAGSGRDGGGRPWRLSLAAAAVFVLLAGIAAVVAGEQGPFTPTVEPRDMLAAAARSASQAGAGGGYRYTVDGSVDVTVRLPEVPSSPALPDDIPSSFGDALDQWLDSLTDGLSGDPRDWPDQFGEFEVPFEEFEGELREQVEEMRERIADAREEAGQALEEAQEQLDRLFDDAFGLSADGSGGTFSVAAEFAGEGAADGAGSTRTDVDWTILEPVEDSGSFEVVNTSDAVFLRAPETDGWVRLEPGRGGFDFDGLLGPGDVDELLEELTDPDGPVEEIGRRTIDGVETRGLRLDVGSVTVEAWVGVEDELLRQLVHRSDVDRGMLAVDSVTTIDFFDHGAAVTITPPEEFVDVSELAPGRWPPFHVSVEVTASGRVGSE